MEIIKASEIKQHYETFIDLAAYYTLVDDVELSTINLNKAQALAQVIGIDFEVVVNDLQVKIKVKRDDNKHYQKALTKLSAIAYARKYFAGKQMITGKVFEEIEQDYTAMVVDMGRDIGYTIDDINQEIKRVLPR